MYRAIDVPELQNAVRQVTEQNIQGWLLIRRLFFSTILARTNLNQRVRVRNCRGFDVHKIP